MKADCIWLFCLTVSILQGVCGSVNVWMDMPLLGLTVVGWANEWAVGSLGKFWGVGGTVVLWPQQNLGSGDIWIKDDVCFRQNGIVGGCMVYLMMIYGLMMMGLNIESKYNSLMGVRAVTYTVWIWNKAWVHKWNNMYVGWALCLLRLSKHWWLWCMFFIWDYWNVKSLNIGHNITNMDWAAWANGFWLKDYIGYWANRADGNVGGFWAVSIYRWVLGREYIKVVVDLFCSKSVGREYIKVVVGFLVLMELGREYFKAIMGLFVFQGVGREYFSLWMLGSLLLWAYWLYGIRNLQKGYEDCAEWMFQIVRRCIGVKLCSIRLLLFLIYVWGLSWPLGFRFVRKVCMGSYFFGGLKS